MIGKTISHYHIMDELGRGGMGTVYKARDTKLDRMVALKFLFPHLSQADEEKKRFIYEAKAASALDHPNICTIHEIGETDHGQMFIVMACYEGESLKDKIDRSPLPIEEAIDIVNQIAQGLTKAHSKEIVHRDIKPANILITEDGQVKIVDFGLAKLAGRTMVTKEGTTLGTVAYMSPEQTQGSAVDHRTDIWAVGVILYEMLTGKRPFEGSYDQAVMYSILNETPEPVTKLNASIPNSLEQVVTKALEKHPDKRYQNVGDFLEDLKSISEGIVPEEIKSRVRKAKLHKRKKIILYSFSAVLIVSAVVVISFLVKRSQVIDSIAVLPLKNLTGDAEQDYFVDGVTDELIGELGQINGLKRVISRTSVMQYKETDKSLSDIARELNVDAIVEGTIYQVGDSIRVRFQLIDVLPEEQNLWGQTYARPMREVLMMYSEVTQAVVREIKMGLIRNEQTRFAAAPPINPEVHEAYLRGNYYWMKATPGDLDIAEKYFNQALEKDPSYAPAYAGLAGVWLVRNQFGLTSLEEAGSKARAAALRAIELDENLAGAHEALASVRTWIDWDWDSARESWQRTIELNPNIAIAQVWYSHFLMITGHGEEALIHSERAVMLDPFNPLVKCFHAFVLYSQRRYDDAVAVVREVQRSQPDYLLVVNGIWWLAHEKKGMEKEGFEAAKVLMRVTYNDPRIEAALDEGYARGGYTEAMKRGAEALIACHPETYCLPSDIATFYTMAGEKDKAIEWFEKGLEVHDPVLPYLGYPLFDDLRTDPRFQTLIRKMNLPVEE